MNFGAMWFQSNGGHYYQGVFKMLSVQKSLCAGLAVVAVLVGSATADAATCRSDRVEANSTDTFTITARAGENVRIAIAGDGDTDLDLYVYDSEGLVVSDIGITDRAVVSFDVYRSGTFTVRVVNRGNVYNNYAICRA